MADCKSVQVSYWLQFTGKVCDCPVIVNTKLALQRVLVMLPIFSLDLKTQLSCIAFQFLIKINVLSVLFLLFYRALSLIMRFCNNRL